MRRLACGVVLFAFALVYSPAAPNSRAGSPLNRFAAGAAAPEEIVPLAFDTPVSGSVPAAQGNACSLGMTQYAIQYPGGATRIRIEINGAPRPLFFVRFGQPVAVENGQVVADFGDGILNSFDFPRPGPHLFEAGTYYIALRNCAANSVDYSFQARLLRPPDADTLELTAETSFGEIPAAVPGSCSLARTQYKITTPQAAPCGSSLYFVEAASNQNINIYFRSGQRVAFEDGRVVADVATTVPATTQFVSVPSGGTFFMAVGNCSLATADYLVTLNHIATLPPAPDIPIVNGCRLERNPNGSFVLDVFGANIKAGATVTVGGVAPKKIRFVELEPGSTAYRTIRLVKKFCGGLPGNIVLTNPQPSCNSTSVPFFCNEACPN